MYTPLNLNQYIGQDSIKKLVQIEIEKAKKTGDTFPHTLISGYSGYGKTTLAKIIANELGAPFYEFVAGSLKTQTDVYELFYNCAGVGAVIFIDEIHGFKLKIEEMFYQPMAEFRLSLYVHPKKKWYGQTPGGWSTVGLEPFVLIGATTLPGKVSVPLRSRCLEISLDKYSDTNMIEMLTQASNENKFSVSSQLIAEVAARSRYCPRHGLNLLDRLESYRVYLNKKELDKQDISDFFTSVIPITREGITQQDKKYMSYLSSLKRPVGVKTISCGISIDIESVQTVIEPYLIERKYVIPTAKGRLLSNKGIKALRSR